MPHVAVIGGGCAGLAAAVRLSNQGVPVTLFEAGRQLGGRARGIKWKDEQLDNGQHILLGAYSETLDLLRLVDVKEHSAFLRLPLQLIMLPRFKLQACSLLPAPLHILAGLLSANGLTWHERLQAVRFMLWMKHNNFRLTEDQPLSALLAAHQPEKLRQLLWAPLCLAALNTPLATASAQVFLNVLRDSFARSKADSDLLLPRADLSSLLVTPLVHFVQQHGGNVMLRSGVTSITRQDDGFMLTTAAPQTATYSHVVIATSPSRMVSITSQLPTLEASRKLCRDMRYQPISTIYLQYAKDVRLPQPMIGFSYGLGQWLFDRGQLCGQHGLLAVVISTAGTHLQLTQQALADSIARELNTHFPQLPAPLWCKVVTEKRATFACTAGLQRPRIDTAIPNLYLAGDYTAGDYPATIEGAYRSGSQCAQAILQSL